MKIGTKMRSKKYEAQELEISQGKKELKTRTKIR